MLVINLCSNLIWLGLVSVEVKTTKSSKTCILKGVQHIDTKQLKADRKIRNPMPYNTCNVGNICIHGLSI